MSGAGRGYAAAVTAYALWGVSPAFWPLLAPADAVESVAHRVAWTLLGMLVVITVARRWSDLRGLPWRTWLLITAGSVLIGVNWGTYIWATTHDHVVDAALGYYGTPLVAVLLAVLVLHERLRPAQWVAIGLAAAAVTVLTVGTGRLPWITLVLAVSFGVYGLVKKRVPLDPVPGLTAEGFLLGPLAIVYIVVIQVMGVGTFTGHGVGHALLLIAAGPVTAVPLLLFAAGAKRLTLATLGVLQYLNPTLQFLFGVLVAGEAMPVSRWIGVSLVWAALLIFTTDALRAGRRAPVPL
ncbi:EamA family transporter RarD [Actinomycetospora lutea]|uniref:EamA family transporter RarD n=1 Tax=Actinomycetospora lutea TaxID=663604 RepID=UPI0023670729|nr:EamA family transporter RarD [Actinomycetospora lutea]MDD7938201.1 EamA family transporter RarD [Actinomycetospora lutea]